MRKWIGLALMLLAVGALGIQGNSPLIAPNQASAADVLGIEIQVSPNVLVISPLGEWVTVHTDLPYSLADPSSLDLNGVPADLTYADARGDLVVKFEKDSIEAIVDVGEATLTLSGLTDDGVPFSGSDTISVKMFPVK